MIFSPPWARLGSPYPFFVSYIYAYSSLIELQIQVKLLPSEKFILRDCNLVRKLQDEELSPATFFACLTDITLRGHYILDLFGISIFSLVRGNLIEIRIVVILFRLLLPAFFSRYIIGYISQHSYSAFLVLIILGTLLDTSHKMVMSFEQKITITTKIDYRLRFDTNHLQFSQNVYRLNIDLLP